LSLTPTDSQPWLVPELGPALGHLSDPRLPGQPSAAPIELDDIRLELATGVFELSGAARAFAAAGDRQGAVASLARVGWLQLWERAVDAAARRMAESVQARLTAAAAVSRLPRARLKLLQLSSEDVRAIASRLGSGGAAFVGALDTLEQAVPGATAAGPRGESNFEEWRKGITAAARRLESAWLALVAATHAEEQRWSAEIDRVRAWRRPTWPLWLLSFVVLAVVTYLGLVFGGYLSVPPLLSPLANLWWSYQ
jgi:hypothetical protein